MNKDLGGMNPTVTALFDEATNTVTYIADRQNPALAGVRRALATS